MTTINTRCVVISLGALTSKKWTRLWQVDVKVGREPEPGEDIQKYTKGMKRKI